MRDGPIDGGTGLGGFRRYTWWSLTGTVTVLLVLFVADWAVEQDVPLPVRAAGGVALAVLVVSVVILLDHRLPRTPVAARPGPPAVTWLAAGGAAAAVLGAIPLALREQELWPLAPAVMTSIAAMFLPPPHRRTLIAAAVVAAAALGGAVGMVAGDGRWPAATAVPAGMVAFVAWTTLGMLWAWDVADRLDRARLLAAELAVKDERLRFAADLHDIQGHHLQVIALKSELAARLAEAEPARAAAEMREVQRLSIDALRDTRAVVQGYRRASLEDEIANAAKVLAAAGIDTTVDRGDPADARALPEPHRHVLGLVVREATTNVLRHSQARRAQVAYRVRDGRARLRVSNDGVADPSRPGSGTGLRALAERLERAGGTLDWHRDGDRFEVVASLPVGTPAAAAEAGAR
ncbi:sensor histidine kinase [Streptosporangium fragile]|uniref:sensor histidine kinase n=1 Tax=Streptosporangium fragile TaxID=46186 RepID=UPI0031E9688E